MCAMRQRGILYARYGISSRRNAEIISMCDLKQEETSIRTVRLDEAAGLMLGHDITEIRPGEFKGRAFKKGHRVSPEDIEHLRRLGKENLFVLEIGPDQLHEDEAALALAQALMGDGVEIEGEPKEGKINMLAARDGLLKIDTGALSGFNMTPEVMCATMHTNTIVRRGKLVAGTRAIPLVLDREIVDGAVRRARASAMGVISVLPMRRPKAGLVITGGEIYHGRIKDAFAPILTRKIESIGGTIAGIRYTPDDTSIIAQGITELIDGGADLIISTGGMSVDPDDVTRHAIRELGATDILYGAPVLPGAMFLMAYLGEVPVLGVPACGMYHQTTVLDLVLGRILAGEHITRHELARMGHGGLCRNCETCRYPVCPFGK